MTQDPRRPLGEIGFERREGRLCAEGLDLSAIAARLDTPFYCYSAAVLAAAWTTLQHATAGLDLRVCFAVKSNGNLAVLREFARLGAGADIVSVGEMQRALQAGIPAGKIVFSGVGKTTAEIRAAVDVGIGQINVESEAELDDIVAVCSALGRPARVLLRVNPDVDAATHAKITTGTLDGKFGLPLAAIPALYRRALALPGIDLQGLAMHIGSQILTADPFRIAFGKLAGLVSELRAAGLPVHQLDLGGGVGVDYRSSTPANFTSYAEAIRTSLAGLDCALTIEPGRALVAAAGLLVTRVIRTKPAPRGWFVIVDAAMNDLLRPALYDAEHEITVIEPAGLQLPALCHIAGPVCESSDIFRRDLQLPLPRPGDLLAIHHAGAYGAVLASSYNARPLIPEVLVRGDQYTIARQRQPLEALLALERFAVWQ